MRESKIESYLKNQFILHLGAEVRKVKWLDRPGAPDKIIMFKGSTLFVEVKATGEKPEPHQVREIRRMLAAGQDVLVVDSCEEVDKLVLWYGWDGTQDTLPTHNFTPSQITRLEEKLGEDPMPMGSFKAEVL